MNKKVKREKIYCIKCNKYRTFIHTFFYKTLVFFIIKCGSNDEKIFKEKESIEILKIFGLINDMEKYPMNI